MSTSILTTSKRTWSGDRCDRDPAERASWVVVFDAGELAFCNHHFQQWETNFLNKEIIELVPEDQLS